MEDIQMNFELTASMMCANYGNLEKEVRDLEEGGIDSFHIDIMDGRYVPNYAMSLNDMRYIRSATDKPLDVHLMIEHPSTHINLFLNRLRKGDTVYITDVKYVYKTKNKIDTILRIDTIPIIQEVEVIKEVNRIKDWQMVLMLLGGGMVAVIGYKIIRMIRI